MIRVRSDDPSFFINKKNLEHFRPGFVVQEMAQDLILKLQRGKKTLTWFLQGSQKTASKVWSVSILYFLSNFVLCSIWSVNLWQNILWLINIKQTEVWHVFEAKEPKGRREYFCNKVNAQHFRFSFTSDPSPRWDKSLAWHWTGLLGASPPPLCGRLLTVSTFLCCLGGETDDQSMQRSQ